MKKACILTLTIILLVLTIACGITKKEPEAVQTDVPSTVENPPVVATEVPSTRTPTAMKPTSTPFPARPTQPPTQAEPDAPAFFYDDFDGPLSEYWIDEVQYLIPEGMEEDDPEALPVYFIEQERGALKFDLQTPWQYVYWTYTPHTYTDIRIDFEIENKGVNTNNVGLVCRYTDYGWYEFIATSGGYYSIMRYYEDGNKELAAGGIKSIRFGREKKNVFTAICQGNYLYFIVNDVEIAKVRDEELPDGYAGINVSAEDVVPVQVDFNWLEFSEP